MYIIPFDSETLKKIITNTDNNKIIISYKNSKLKDKKFLLYLSNLKKLDFYIDLSDTTFEERAELLLEYVRHQTTLEIKQFTRTLVKILFRIKMYDLNVVNEIEGINFVGQVINDDEIDAVIQKDVQLFKDFESIVDGVLLYAIKNINKYKQQIGDFITPNIVEASTSVGKTFINLFQDEVFNEHYYSTLPDFINLKYFEHYYDRPIYSGRTLLTFLQDKCLIFPILDLILEEYLTPHELAELEKESFNVSSV